MNKATWLSRTLCYAPTTVLLSIGGCLAGVYDAFDMIVAPEALSNALRLPASDVLPLAELFTRFWIR